MAYEITDDIDTTDLGKIQNDAGDSAAGVVPIALPDSESSEDILISTKSRF